jgi:small-conductance mechanosensitive channel
MLCVPLNELLTGLLIDKKKRMEVRVQVAYGTDLERVLKIVKDTALADSRILKDPAPFSIVSDFKEYSIEIELRARTEKIESFSSIRSSLILDITCALAQESIKIPLPQRYVHIITDNSLKDESDNR